MKKVPFMLVVGEKEAQSGTVAVRRRNGEQSTVSIEEFIKQTKDLIDCRSLTS